MRVHVTVAFEDSSETPLRFSRTFEIAKSPAESGQKMYATELLVAAEADLIWADYWGDLPKVETVIENLRQTFSLDDLASGMYDERRTVQWIWLEIANLLHQTKIILARAKAFKTIESRYVAANTDENTLANIHITKLESLNLAVIYLAKVNDLILRLVFESFGGTLVPVDRAKPEWERELTWENIKEGLKERNSNPRLKEITDEEYNELRDILARLRGSHVYRTFIRYRNAVAHRAQPLVDYPQFHNAPEVLSEWTINRDAEGREVSRVRGFGGRKDTPDYTFEGLYATATTTFKHWVQLLQRLRSMPRFGPEAIR
ncbi:MAG TPA: hypothetical protein VFU86_15770 [Terriglobales bacterium]|nr:hypothetical protein [Terriglobales bacterium]